MGMGFHPKNGLHQCMKVGLFISTFWICFKNRGSSLKSEKL